jgi:hypothetical protein
LGREIARLRDELGTVLFDPAAPDASDHVEVALTATFNDVQRELEKYFRSPDAADAVVLAAAGERLGVVSKKSLGLPGLTLADSSGSPEVGAGERLALPGLSTQYKLLKFRCKRCDSNTFAMYNDTRSLGACENGHREWRFQGEA